jgi:hypothetical protein
MTPFSQGLQDRKDGKDIEQCPFQAESESWAEWRRGWLIASTSRRLTEPSLKPLPRERE